MSMRRVVGMVGAAALVAGGLGFLAAPEAGAAQHVCKGTPQSPGHLSGTTGDVVVQGACAVDQGLAHVRGNLTVTPGSVLAAAFGHNHSRLSVDGDVLVQSGGTAIIGCNTTSFTCIDEPSQDHPTLSSHAHVGHNVIGNGALGILMHNADVGIDVIETGGGGGFNCNPQGIFKLFQSPVFSAFEDSTVGGNIRIRAVNSCWAGINRVHVAGDVVVNNSKYADPDAIEILSNVIQGNLSCHGDSRTWDSGDLSDKLFPRQPEPNTVHGTRSGQCLLNSPTSPKDKPGPGPF